MERTERETLDATFSYFAICSDMSTQSWLKKEKRGERLVRIVESTSLKSTYSTTRNYEIKYSRLFCEHLRVFSKKKKVKRKRDLSPGIHFYHFVSSNSDNNRRARSNFIRSTGFYKLSDVHRMFPTCLWRIDRNAYKWRKCTLYFERITKAKLRKAICGTQTCPLGCGGGALVVK